MELTLVVPYMHAELAPEPLPLNAVLLDPGAARNAQPGTGGPEALARYAPDNLPLEPAAARQCLADMEEYARQFKDAKDLPRQTGGLHDSFAAASFSSAEEFRDLNRFVAGDAAPAEQEPVAAKDDDAPLRAAQLSLLLVWSLENQALALAALDKGMTAAWEKFNAAVSGEDADVAADLAAGGLSAEMAGEEGAISPLAPLGAQSLAQVGPPPESVLAHMLAFVPAKTRLYPADPQLATLWADMELPPDGEVLGWKLAGFAGPQEGRPWLDRYFIVAAYPQSRRSA